RDAGKSSAASGVSRLTYRRASSASLVGLPTIGVVLERSAVPAGMDRRRFVGVLQEPQQHFVWIGCLPHCFIRQQVFAQIRVVVGFRRLDWVVGEAVGFG